MPLHSFFLFGTKWTMSLQCGFIRSKVSTFENFLIKQLTFWIFAAAAESDLHRSVGNVDKSRVFVVWKIIKIIAQDGPTDYIRQTLNQMDNETFRVYIDYHFKTCERLDLIGASSHTLDILEV